MMNESYVGHAESIAGSSNEYTRIAAVVKQMTGRMAGATIVKVIAVHSNGMGVAGTVDVQPQVHQITGDGLTVPHDVIYGVPYSRIQGGASAVIIDPAINDLGICVFADRDISAVKNTLAAAPPGSRRMNNMSDGMYVGALLNGTPTQYVDFTGGQTKIVSPNKVTIQAPEVDINTASLKVNGDSMTHNNVNVGSTHRHTAEGATAITSVPE